MLLARGLLCDKYTDALLAYTHDICEIRAANAVLKVPLIMHLFK